MATNDIQIRNDNGTWQSLFPISMPGKSTSWYSGRDAVLIKTNSSGTSAYCPLFSIKSANGSWDVGTYTNNALHFSYITDTDYNNKNNNQKADITFDINGRINSKALLNAYPVGAVYISWSSTSPASLFGGSWSEIKGRFPYFNHGTGTGGENTHKLTVKEMPSHNHTGHGTSGVDFTLGIHSSAAGSVSRSTSFVEGGSGNKWIRFTHSTQSTGGNSAHQNMPSYQTFYAWRRTA